MSRCFTLMVIMGKNVIVMMQKHNGPNSYLAKYNLFSPSFFAFSFWREICLGPCFYDFYACLTMKNKPPSSLWFCVCSFWMTLAWEEKEEAVLCSCRWPCRDGSSKRSLVRRLSNQKRPPQILNRWAQTALELKWRVRETSLNVQRRKHIKVWSHFKLLCEISLAKFILKSSRCSSW